MNEDEKANEIDETNIEKLIPNYANLDKDEKMRCLESIYHKQRLTKFSYVPGTNLYELIKEQQRKREVEMNG